MVENPPPPAVRHEIGAIDRWSTHRGGARYLRLGRRGLATGLAVVFVLNPILMAMWDGEPILSSG